MKTQKKSVIEKHLDHKIEVIDQLIFANGPIHHGKIMCANCNILIKWASDEEIEFVRKIRNKEININLPGINYRTFDEACDAHYKRNRKPTQEEIKKQVYENYHRTHTNPEKGTYNVYLNVPFAKKDEVKKLGAKWDHVQKSWFINSHHPKAHKLREYMNQKDFDNLHFG